MRKFNVEWETAFCEDYDRMGNETVEAEDIHEAVKKIKEKIYHAVVIRVNEIK